jgi:hypothetical protein
MWNVVGAERTSTTQVKRTPHAEGLVDPKVLAKKLILDTPEHADSEYIKK